MNNPFPTTRSEQACMFACYLLTALLAVMVLWPHKVAALLIGGFA
jgi:hypothetical protein